MKRVMTSFYRITGRPQAIAFRDVGKILQATIGIDQSRYHRIADRNVWESGSVLLLDPSLLAIEQQAPERLTEVSEIENMDEDRELDTQDDFSGVMNMIIPSYARDDVEYDTVSGEVQWGSSTLSKALDEVVKPYIEGQGDKRVVLALGEKKRDSVLSVGHFTVLVIDKVNDQYSATIVDSLVPSRIKNVVLEKVMGHIFLNANDAIKTKLEEVLGARVDFQRLYYNHQAAVLDNSCGFFTAKLMEHIYKNSQAEIRPIQDIMQADISIVDRLEVLTTRSHFLKSEDLSQMQEIIQKPSEVLNQGAPNEEINDHSFRG